MTQALTTTEELRHLASSDNTNELTRRLARECLASREAQPVGYLVPGFNRDFEWGYAYLFPQSGGGADIPVYLATPAAPGCWITCREQMPEPNKYVQVSNGVWVGIGMYNDADHLDDEEHWQDEHNEFIDLLHHPVTHWMPLPAAPEVTSITDKRQSMAEQMEMGARLTNHRFNVNGTNRAAMKSDIQQPNIEDLNATAPGLGKIPPMTAELANILGRPNFQCCHIAQALRAGGHEIPRKAEAEQAAVIYFMLGHYLEHGDKWSEKAEEELQRLVATGALK